MAQDSAEWTPLIAVRGAGDLGSGCALRLMRCGFRVLAVEQARPTAVRRTVSFSEAVYDGEASVEEVRGVLVLSETQVQDAWRHGMLPLAVDPDLTMTRSLHPHVIVDALLLKRNQGMSRDLAPGTVALGPGFVAGHEVDAVVETDRGPNLGRVIWAGRAEDDTGTPSPTAGHAEDRVLRAPRAGLLHAVVDIGDVVQPGQAIASVEGELILAPFHGLVRGLIRPGLLVDANMKVGDVDPRLDPELCRRVSDKALAVAGGVIEAAMVLLRRQGLGPTTRAEPALESAG